MNEEMMTYEELDVVENTEVEDTYVEPVSNGGISAVGAFVGGTLVAGAVGGAAWLWNKTKAKREELAVKKLEKKGYIITKAEIVEDIDPEVDEIVEDDAK